MKPDSTKGTHNHSVRINTYIDATYRTLLALLICCGGKFNDRCCYAVITAKTHCTRYYMNSKERHELRYQRRKAKRAAKKRRLQEEYCDFDKVFTYEHLYQSYLKCRRGVSWKESVQKFGINAALNINKLLKKIKSGQYRHTHFYEFDIIEKGKQRHIQSIPFEERIVVRCLCDYSLTPLIHRLFIYDNGACIKNKGVSFTVNRMTRHLRRFYKQHNNKGYVLIFDFSQYFKNIDHQVLLRILRKEIIDDRIFGLVSMFINSFGERGLGLGSQLSQLGALLLPNVLDHIIKEQLHIKCYCRYMDDGCLIHESKEYLQYCLTVISGVCEQLGITLNAKKTHIIKLSRGFEFLKVRFFLTDKGKVVRKPRRKNITLMRRKIKAMRRLLSQSRITLAAIKTSFMSWLGYQRMFHSYWARNSMRSLYNQLFQEDYHNGLAIDFVHSH